MHILLSFIFAILHIVAINTLHTSDFQVSDHIVQVSTNVDDEELVYNGVVYLDDLEDWWSMWVNSDIEEKWGNKTINNEKKYSNLEKNVIDNSNNTAEWIIDVVDLQDSDDEEVEIIFHDEFDSWYWEDLENYFDE